MKTTRYKALEFKHTGENHKDGSYNQDYTSVRSMDDGSIVAAVADGCSSEPLSGIGSYFLCEGITSYFSETDIDISSLSIAEIKNIIDNIISRKINFLCDTLKNISECTLPDFCSLHTPPHIFSCTLMVVIAFANMRQIVYHIGDGVILGRRKSSKIVDVISSGRNIGSQCRTYFATDFDFSNNVFVREFSNGAYTDILLTTDGLQKALTNGNDTLSNLKNLVLDLSNYGNTFTEDFNTNLKDTRDKLLHSSPNRVGDDISCVFLSEFHTKEIFNTDSSVSITVKTNPSSLYEVTGYSFKNSKLQIKVKKKRNHISKPTSAPILTKTHKRIKADKHTLDKTYIT